MEHDPRDGGGSFVIEGMYEKLAPVGTLTIAYLHSVKAYKYSSCGPSCCSIDSRVRPSASISIYASLSLPLDTLQDDCEEVVL